MDAFILDSNQYELMLEGTWLTIQILAYSFILGVLLSLVFGVGRLSEREWVRGAALVYVEFARGISSIILLFIMAIAVPVLIQVRGPSLVLLGSVALGINMGGYGAEIVRGAIQSIPRGQSEASLSLNLSPTQRLRFVILPQAMRIILPPMGNLTIEILKGTALVALIGLTDLMQSVRLLNTQQIFAGSPGALIGLYMNALLIYFVLSQVINGLFRFGESRLNRRYEARSSPPPADAEPAAPEVAG